ncbi:MAG: hypothetical protein ACK55I_09265, partial [bacterium]
MSRWPVMTRAWVGAWRTHQMRVGERRVRGGLVSGGGWGGAAPRACGPPPGIFGDGKWGGGGEASSGRGLASGGRG